DRRREPARGGGRPAVQQAHDALVSIEQSAGGSFRLPTANGLQLPTANGLQLPTANGDCYCRLLRTSHGAVLPMKRFLALALIVAALAAAGEPPAGVGGLGIGDVQRVFLEPPPDSRIMMRWWWFGPSVTRDELDAEMRRMKEGGIGGFEVAAVYPMATDDPSRGIHNDAYLSPAFLDALAFTARRARELGLRMDLTLGSGWPFGGPYITPELASTRLRSERREIAAGVTSVARPQTFETDRLIAAFIGRGSAQEADPSAFRELSIAGNGALRLPAGAGPRVVLFYF